jgi:hypothetical protein
LNGISAVDEFLAMHELRDNAGKVLDFIDWILNRRADESSLGRSPNGCGAFPDF